MNAWFEVDGAWQLAGWTMLHFLWIGAAAGVLGAALRIACRRAAPSVRYAVSLGTLAVIAALPVGIAGWLAAQPRALPGDSPVAAIDSRAIPGQSPGLSVVHDTVVIDLAKTPILNLSPAPNPSEPGRLGPGVAAVGNPSPNPLAPRPLFDLPGRGILDAAVAYLPWVWLVGAPLTFVLLAAGLVGSKRLRTASTLLESGPAAEACARLRTLMHITRRVLVAVSDAVAQPVLVGIVRPTILLPAAALSGWTPEELEMVLLHELAHVRRWDNLVNLVQRIVESLLFFHPAVWLASRQVRRDREECCDAAVVRHTARPAEYAELLVAIAGRARRGRGAGTRPAEAGLALASAMADHPLAGRIRRILKLEDESMRVSRGTLIAALTSIGLTVVVVMTLPHSMVNADEEKPAVKKTDGRARDAKKATDEAVWATYYIKPNAVKQMQPFVEQNHKKLGLQVYVWSSDYRRILARASAADQKRFGKLLAEKDWFALKTPSGSPTTVAATTRTEELRPANRPVTTLSGPPGPWDPSAILLHLPERVRDSDDELSRTIEQLKSQGFVVGFSQSASDTDHMKMMYARPPEEGVWKPVWETRMEGDKQITVVRMVREDVRYDDPAAPTSGSPVLAQPSLQSTSGPVAVVQPYPASGMRAGRKLQPGDRVDLDVVGAYPDRPLTDIYQIEPEGTLALGATYGRVPIAGHTVLEAEELIRAQLGKTLTDVEVQLVLKEPARDVLIPTAAAPWPTPAANRETPLPANTWNAAPAVAASTYSGQTTPKKSVKELEIEEKLSTPVRADFVETPLVEAVSLLSDTAKVNIYIDPRGIDEEGLSADVPVSLVLPNEISVKSALKLVLEPLHLTYVIEDEVVKITSETTRDRAAAAQFLRPQPAPPVPRYSAPKVDEGATILTPAFPKPTSAAPPTPADPQSAAAPADATSAQKTRYLYDGKEFAQWRSLWQEELKTERRMEAIEALAAFGRAGYGREAVEAVFDVAGQYDFQTMDKSAEGKLKSRVIELLTNYGATRLPETLWLPVLEQRLQTEPARWKWLAYWLLGSLQTSDAAVMERLFELAKSEDKDIRAGAIAAIGKSDRKREDPRIIELADKFLGSSDPGEIMTGVVLLEYSPEGNSVYSRLRFRPAIIDALFFADENVRKVARQSLKNIDEKEAAPVVEQLLARLKTSEAKDERLAALRAIAAIGPKASAAESAMTALIEDYNDLELAAAAAVAVDRLHDGETKDGSVYHPGRDLYYKRIQAGKDGREINRGNNFFNKESTEMNNSLRNVNRGGGGGFF